MPGPGAGLRAANISLPVRSHGRHVHMRGEPEIETPINLGGHGIPPQRAHHGLARNQRVVDPEPRPTHLGGPSGCGLLAAFPPADSQAVQFGRQVSLRSPAVQIRSGDLRSGPPGSARCAAGEILGHHCHTRAWSCFEPSNLLGAGPSPHSHIICESKPLNSVDASRPGARTRGGPPSSEHQPAGEIPRAPRPHARRARN